MSDFDREGEHLLEDVARGDAGAVKACVERFSPLVWSLAKRYCRSSADAEDATQDIFLDLWRSAGRFDPRRASAATFVATLARRRLIDRRRREERAPRTEPIDLVGESAAFCEEHPVEVSEEAARARAVLAQLKPVEQQVLRGSIYHGLSHSELAAQLGIPLGTVKTSIRRGLDRLRSVLGAGGSRVEVTP